MKKSLILSALALGAFLFINFNSVSESKTSQKKGKMPPKKFLAKYPDKDISPKDKEKLQKWAKEMATKLAE